MLSVHIVLLLCTASALGLPSEPAEAPKPAEDVLRPKLSYSRRTISKPGTDETIDCGIEGIDLTGVQGFNIQWSKINPTNPIHSYPISLGEQVVLFSDKYSVLHPENSHTYSLKIKDINEEDQGNYRCTVHFGNAQKITADVPVMVEKAPYFNTKMTRALTVKAGDSISIDCQPGGYPTPTVYWQRVDNRNPFSASSFAQKNQIEISDAKSEDEGMYVCHADNGVGEPVTSKVIINVMYKPRLSVSKKVQVVELQQPVSVSCLADAYDAATIVWKKNGQVVANSYNTKITNEIIPRPKTRNFPGAETFSVKPDFAKSTLSITRVSEEEAGEYVCEASNQAGKSNTTVSILVKTPPMIVNQSGRKSYYEDPIGGRHAVDVVLECEASGVPTPQVSWMKDGEPLKVQASDRMHIDSSGSLVIQKPFMEDNGLYQCLAFNEHGAAKSDLMYLVNATKVSFTENKPAGHTEDVSADEGRPFRLKCPRAVGDPEPTITWIKVMAPNEEGRVAYAFVESKRMVVGPDGSLFFTHVTMEDDFETSGIKYMCSAFTNVSPTDYSVGLEYAIKVVKPADGIHNANNPEYNISAAMMFGTLDQTLQGGQDNSIHCIFGGEPEPSIYWERADGKSLKDPEMYVLDNHNTTLVLKNTNLDHVAKYRCIGSNGVGKAMIHEIGIEVVQPPMFKDDSLQSFSVKEGEDVSFKCDADATGAITYSWFFNGNPISLSGPSSSRKKAEGSMLNIDSVSVSDIGNYACNATSTDGYAYGQSTLNVESRHPVSSNADYAEVHHDIVEIRMKLDALVASQAENAKVYDLLKKIAVKLEIELPVEGEKMKEESQSGVIGVMTEPQEKTKVEKPRKVSGISLTKAAYFVR